MDPTISASLAGASSLSGGSLAGASGASSATSASGGFGEVLGKYLGEVDSLQKQADTAVSGLATGQVKDVHDVMLAMNDADMSFRLMLEVRNKLVDAYQEVSKIQV